MSKTKLALWIVVLVAVCVTALQIAGPYLFGFGNWCNVIQYVSGYEDIGGACVIIHLVLDYYTNHKPRLKQMEEHLFHLRKEKENA